MVDYRIPALALFILTGAFISLAVWKIIPEYKRRAIVADHTLPVVEARVIDYTTSELNVRSEVLNDLPDRRLSAPLHLQRAYGVNYRIVFEFTNPFTGELQSGRSGQVYRFDAVRRIRSGTHESNTRAEDDFGYIAIRVGSDGTFVVLPFHKDERLWVWWLLAVSGVLTLVLFVFTFRKVCAA